MEPSLFRMDELPGKPIISVTSKGERYVKQEILYDDDPQRAFKEQHNLLTLESARKYDDVIEGRIAAHYRGQR